ncbi:hypothetical protein CUMW_189070 [Citrus unshiu]|nr:hypothetical protein CUMW_189070 [Citrus unshiu]
MIPGGATSCFPNMSQASLKAYPVPEDNIVSSSLQTSSSPGPASNPTNSSLLYSVFFLKEKIHQLQSVVTVLVSQGQATESTSIAMANMGSLIQEIIITASSLMVTCQQMSTLPAASISGNNNNNNITANEIFQQQQHVGPNNQERSSGQQGYYFTEAFDICYGDNNDYVTTHDHNRGMHNNVINSNDNTNITVAENRESFSEIDCDIIELVAGDLLAKYTHYCQVCGKGFKRDANLRMHMRAHGDEYKTTAALTNPLKKNGSSMGNNNESAIKIARKYSCPQEGCRWNKKHAKFQPLKSMICAKNHYKRSHCPKMYVCKRCNRKQFSVLSDLRTHEKHCGDLKWQCSCGTTFSRKDKLMGHVALFVGHTPAVNVNSTNMYGQKRAATGTNAIT